MESRPTLPKIELTLNDKRVLRFETFEEVQRFFNREQGFFTPLVMGNVGEGEANSSVERLRNRFRSMETMLAETSQTVNQIDSRPNIRADEVPHLQRQLARHAEQLTSGLSEMYRSDSPIWPSDSPNSQFVASLAEKNRLTAVYAMLHLRGDKFVPLLKEAREGAFLAESYKLGIREFQNDAFSKSIQITSEQWREKAVKFEASWEKFLGEAQKQKNGQADEFDEVKKAHAGLIKEFQAAEAQRLTDFAAQMRKAQADLDAVKAAYDTHMKLKAPVDYWRNKERRHRSEAKVLRWTCLILGSGLLAALFVFTDNFFDEGAKGAVPWRHIFGFFVISTAAFWVMRVVVKLFLSAQHLAEDAAERTVMAETFMALVRGTDGEAKYLEEKDRALVLTALFRPAATGVVDEGPTSPASDLLSKLLQK